MKRIIKFQLISFFKQPFLLVLVILIGMVIFLAQHDTQESGTQSHSIPIAVLDEDFSDASQLVIRRLKENNLLELVETDEPMTALMRWDIDALFIMKEGFSEKLAEGDIERIVDLYYSPGSVTAEIIAEMFSKEVMRIYITQEGIDFIGREYEKRSVGFDSLLQKEALDHTESYWEKGQTISISHKYLEGKDVAEKTIDFKSIVADTIVFVFLLIFVLFSGVPFMVQKERGILKRLVFCGLSPRGYIVACVLTNISVFIAMMVMISGIDPETFPYRECFLYSLLFIWIGFVMSLLICILKHVQSMLLLVPVMAIVIGIAGGALVYYSEVWSAVYAIGYLNPVYCVVQGRKYFWQGAGGLLCQIMCMGAILFKGNIKIN